MDGVSRCADLEFADIPDGIGRGSARHQVARLPITRPAAIVVCGPVGEKAWGTTNSVREAVTKLMARVQRLLMAQAAAEPELPVLTRRAVAVHGAEEPELAGASA